jgi:hypothetical protein
MAINPARSWSPSSGPKHQINVYLDDREPFFPAGKSIKQLLFCQDGKTISIEAVFPLQSIRMPHMVLLDLEDSREFGRRLVEAVHCAHANGGHRQHPLHDQRGCQRISPAIWRHE